MACSRCSLQLFRVPAPSLWTGSRAVSTTSVVHGRRGKEPRLLKWGLEKFPRQHNSSKCRPLVELPDYTYLDGRPTPMTKKQLEEKERNYQLAKRIVMLTKEMEAAKAAHAKRLQDEATIREDILRSKLKQKSDQL